nr:MAG TPA: Baseplate structural protein [Caudoviricetes sp.]
MLSIHPYRIAVEELASHNHTIHFYNEELASHNHTYVDAPHMFYQRDTSQNFIICTNSNESSNEYTYNTSSSGGNKPHNNLSPVYACYRFRRTA